MIKKNYSVDIYNLANKLFPINRSITGKGVRNSFKIIKKI